MILKGKPKGIPQQKKDCLMTWMSGSEFMELSETRVFMKSSMILNSVDKFFLTTSETPQNKIAEIQSKYRLCAMPDLSPANHILRDRWYHWYHELVAINAKWKYRYICLCDAKDVCFQANPFDFMAKNFEGDNHFVLFFEEGMKHRDSRWNLIDQFEFQKDCKEYQCDDFKDWPVVNAGVVLGTPREVMNLCMLMWSMYLKTQGRCSDQAALNYLLNRPLRHDGIHTVVSPHYCPLVLTGEAVKEKHIDVKYDGQAYNPKLKERYYMFHQWDRTEYRQVILDSVEK